MSSGMTNKYLYYASTSQVEMPTDSDMFEFHEYTTSSFYEAIFPNSLLGSILDE